MGKLSVLSLLNCLTYRLPMMVRELMVFPNSTVPTSFYVCPRCHITVEREFMAYCDRCGQCLDWKMHAQAKIIFPVNYKKGQNKKPRPQKI